MELRDFVEDGVGYAQEDLTGGLLIQSRGLRLRQTSTAYPTPPAEVRKFLWIISCEVPLTIPENSTYCEIEMDIVEQC